ncbi:CapA family protein [Leptolyngbya sp. KIOST-1]|uniref:CapA family protein n=1 Tax=Leptolyngbya sp. KIOST-1 TaxID=1229172 RepID=UPI00068D9231|nr:CapA family protein [Leptolyngbya sp. KIOST-1]
MSIADLTQSVAWTQAQAGNLGAIAQILATVVDDSRVRVEVSRRDRTLYVFLTAAPPLPLDLYLPPIHAAVSALRLETIAHLKVLDGTEKRLLNRWQRDFDLDPGLPAPPMPQAAQAHETVLPAQAEGHSQMAHSPESAGIPQGLPAAGQAEHGLAAPRDRRWPWALTLTAIGLGFGLAGGVTQWRYTQQRPAEVADAELTAADVTQTSAATLPAIASGTPPEATPLQPLIAERTAAIAPPVLATPVTLTIKAVGDIIPGSDYQRYRLPEDWQYLFGSIQYHLGDADITFGNFESTLTEVPRSAKDTSRGNVFAFRTPPWYASVLKEAGFDVLSVANNHSMDFAQQGFEDTIAHIEAAGMKAVGRKNEILYVEARGQTVAFIGFSTYPEHNRVQDLEAAIALVQTAKAQADIVVVSFHAGKEGTDATVTRDQTEFFFSENRGNVVQFSRTVIDHGADLVLGHGPHVPRALELYQGKLIAYSLGNFVGYRSLSTVGPLGTSLILQTDLDAGGNFVGGRIIPVALDRNGVPYLDDHFGGVILIRQFTQRDFPDTPLTIDDLGYIWPQ